MSEKPVAAYIATWSLAQLWSWWCHGGMHSPALPPGYKGYCPGRGKWLQVQERNLCLWAVAETQHRGGSKGKGESGKGGRRKITCRHSLLQLGQSLERTWLGSLQTWGVTLALPGEQEKKSLLGVVRQPTCRSHLAGAPSLSQKLCVQVLIGKVFLEGLGRRQWSFLTYSSIFYYGECLVCLCFEEWAACHIRLNTTQCKNTMP